MAYIQGPYIGLTISSTFLRKFHKQDVDSDDLGCFQPSLAGASVCGRADLGRGRALGDGMPFHPVPDIK